MSKPISILASGTALVLDAYQRFGWKVPLLFGLTVANALLEGLTLAALLPLFQTLGMGGQGGVVAVGTSAVLEWLGLPLTSASIGEIAIALLGASLLIFIAQAWLATRLQAQYVADWQRRLFDAVISSRWTFLRRQPTGDIVAHLTTEPARVGGAFYQANLIASSFVFLCVQIAIAAAIAPIVTAMLLVVSMLLFRATRRMVSRAVRIGRDLTKANGELFATAGEIGNSLKTVKASSGELDAKERLDVHFEAIRDLSFRNSFDVQLVRAIFEYASTASIILLVICGPLFLHVDIAAVLIVIAIFVRLFPKVTGLRQCLQSIGLVLPAFEAARMLKLQAEMEREGEHRGKPLGTFGPAAIQLENVDVRGDRGESVLRGIDLSVSPGENVVLVGSTGAGKTSVLDCVLGLAQPWRGRVLVDACDLNNLDVAEWRRSVGYLGQEPVMWAGTLRSNVTWTRTGASDRDVEEALRAADAGFALELPGGLNAVISERGGTLSGGERQRIALARALLGSPRLLVLDEATSALDIETECRIASAIRNRRGSVTVITVTHRLFSTREADRIVLLECGQVVEQGKFADLIRRDGRFAALWRAQEERGEPALVAPR